MKVQRIFSQETNDVTFELLDDASPSPLKLSLASCDTFVLATTLRILCRPTALICCIS